MVKEVISTPKVATPPAPISMATKSGNLVFVAGIVALSDSVWLMAKGSRVESRRGAVAVGFR